MARKAQPREVRREAIRQVRQARFAAAFPTEKQRVAYLTERIEKIREGK